MRATTLQFVYIYATRLVEASIVACVCDLPAYLGKLRSMRAFVIGLLLFGVFALTARWFYVCRLRGLCDAPSTKVVVRPLTLSLMQGDSAVVDEFQQFAFAKNAAEPLLTENNRVFLKTVLAWMKAFPNWHLQIEAYQLPSETEQPVGMYDFLALARAAAVRDSLLQGGAAADRIDLHFGWRPDSVGLTEPIAFFALHPDSAHVHMPFALEHMAFTNRHFQPASGLFQPASSFFQYVDSLRAWLQTHPGYVLHISEYADCASDLREREALAPRRAQQVADFLRDYELPVLIRVESTDRPQSRVSTGDLRRAVENPCISLHLLPLAGDEEVW